MFSRKLPTLILCFSLLSGCTNHDMYENLQVKEAQVTDRTRAGDLLSHLPPPSEKIAVALYDFQDQTGQFKNNDKFTDYSSAVTKGGHAILTKALLDAGNKQWFTVTERGSLKDLLQERQIIKVMRNEYHANNNAAVPDLPPLLYGGMLIEGGIISYDSNIITGGAGAIYLGIGANAQYHRDLVTVYLRAVSIQTGEVLLSVTSSKTIFSTSIDSNILKYITFDRLLQAEAGFSVNEPTQLGVRQAIETAVYSLIMEGAIDKLWDFKDNVAGQRAMADYVARRDGPPAPKPQESWPPARSDAPQNPGPRADTMPMPAPATAVVPVTVADAAPMSPPPVIAPVPAPAATADPAPAPAAAPTTPTVAASPPIQAVDSAPIYSALAPSAGTASNPNPSLNANKVRRHFQENDYEYESAPQSAQGKSNPQYMSEY